MPVTPQPTPRRLAVYLRRAARDAGYDVDIPRSGAIKRLAHDSGIPQANISRALKGDQLPDIRRYQPLADTLHVPVTDLLIEAGLITQSTDATPQTTPPKPATPVPSPHTPEDAALALGIPPEDRPLFVELVKRLIRRTHGGTT